MKVEHTSRKRLKEKTTLLVWREYWCISSKFCICQLSYSFWKLATQEINKSNVKKIEQEEKKTCKSRSRIGVEICFLSSSWARIHLMFHFSSLAEFFICKHNHINIVYWRTQKISPWFWNRFMHLKGTLSKEWLLFNVGFFPHTISDKWLINIAKWRSTVEM